MALAAHRAMSVVYGFRDQEGTETDMRIHMTNPIFGVVDFVAFIAYLEFAKIDLANAAAALSDSPLTRIGITLRELETNPGPSGSGEAENKGVFLFLDEDGAPLFRMAIPGIKASVLQANGRDINLSNATVQAFITAMTGPAGVTHPVTANLKDVISVPLGNAYKQHRNSHTGRSRRTG